MASAPVPTASARFEDNMAERTKPCTACHGDQGRAGPDGYYPRLAVKPAGYLHNPVSYTHLDVYKRQAENPAPDTG